MKLLSAGQHAKSAWKNGKGETVQIAIFPEDARFPEDDFLWRVSVATLTSVSDFSLFPGYARKLIIWEGEGLELNGKLLLPKSCFSFTGDQQIHAKIIGNEVRDLGVIFQPSKGKVEIEVITLQINSAHYFPCTDGVRLVFCAQGNVISGELNLGCGDVLQLTRGDSCTCVSSAASAKLIQVSMRGFSDLTS